MTNSSGENRFMIIVGEIEELGIESGNKCYVVIKNVNKVKFKPRHFVDDNYYEFEFDDKNSKSANVANKEKKKFYVYGFTMYSILEKAFENNYIVEVKYKYNENNNNKNNNENEIESVSIRRRMDEI